MSRTYFSTPKGTELPLLALRGKEYLEVKYRIVWFREDHADWSIETELISVNADSACAKATIRDEAGRIIATSHKFENVNGFPDFIEKAETGSIGRALALIGYGTQFCADELDEGARVVDSPIDTKTKKSMPAKVKDIYFNDDPAEVKNLSNFMLTFGKHHKGKTLGEMDPGEISGLLKWCHDEEKKPGFNATKYSHIREFMDKAKVYLRSIEEKNVSQKN